MKLICFIFSVFITVVVGRDLNVPQRTHLVAYWPLDRDDGHKDVVITDRMPNPAYMTLATDLKGPHGQYGTAYLAGNFTYSTYSGYPWHNEFTLSFFISTKASERGGVITIGQASGFNILYDSPGTLIIHSRSETLIGQVSFSPNDGEWQFFAVTFFRNTLTVYDRTGETLLLVSTDKVSSSANPYVDFGRAWDQSGPKYMTSTDALSCVMWFKTPLTASEISELPTICKRNSRAILWPQPQNLVGFWPLNALNIIDLSTNKRNGAVAPKLVYTTSNGPYGKHGSALKIESNDSYVFHTTSGLNVPTTSTFSVLLHFAKDDNNYEGCIFEFLDKFGTEKAFQICYSNRSFVDVYANDITIGRFNMIQQKGAWTFMAFVFDGNSLTVYSKHGVLSAATPQPHVRASNSFNNNGVKLGYSTKLQKPLSPGDKFACLMVYESALSANDVRLAQKSCRVVLGSATCGSSKQVVAKVPYLSGDVTTVPQPGQFPWIASVRQLNRHVCSATVLDQYWLLTSAKCFPSSDPRAADYSVVIGELNLNESAMETHFVEKIIVQQKSPVTNGEYAIISLSDPIDFTSDMVNDACALSNDIKTDLKTGFRLLVHGWGVNGRNALASDSLPRYFSGVIMTDKQCQRAWGDDDYQGGNKNYCFFSLTTDKDVPCSGDFGAPLMGQASENVALGYGERLINIGLFYKRDSNCTASKPGLFVGLDEALFGWVTENIACAVPGVEYPSSCPQKDK